MVVSKILALFLVSWLLWLLQCVVLQPECEPDYDKRLLREALDNAEVEYEPRNGFIAELKEFFNYKDSDNETSEKHMDADYFWCTAVQDSSKYSQKELLNGLLLYHLFQQQQSPQK